MQNSILSYSLGFLFSVVIGHFIIAFIMSGLWGLIEEVNSNSKYRKKQYLTRLLGILERIMFTTAFIIGEVQFIGFWIALKVAGSWNAWNDKDNGRIIFNNFLIGCALNVFYSYVGAMIFNRTIIINYIFSIILLLIFIGFSLLIVAYVKYSKNKENRKPQI